MTRNVAYSNLGLEDVTDVSRSRQSVHIRIVMVLVLTFCDDVMSIRSFTCRELEFKTNKPATHFAVILRS